VVTQAAFLFCVCCHVRNKARNADMEARQPSLPDGISGMHVADKECALSTLQAVFLGVMLSWTPSLLFMAHLLWRAPLVDSD
jgi:hypothetical protein